MQLTRFTIAAIAAMTLTVAACGTDSENPKTAEPSGDKDPTSICAPDTDCSDIPEADQNPDEPAGDPFLTCEAGNEDCTSDTDQGDQAPGEPGAGTDTGEELPSD